MTFSQPSGVSASATQQSPVIPTATHGRRRWYMRTSGMRLLDAKVDTYERMTARTDKAPTALLEELHRCLEGQFTDLGRVDAAWAKLHELREWLCTNALYDDLLTTIAVDIQNDIAYLEPTRTVKAREELEHLLGDLQRGGPDDAHLRLKLRVLSTETARAREAIWLQVNMTRNRVLIMGAILMVLLIVALALLPAALPSHGGFAFIVGVALFGAMGGTISGLVGREKARTLEADFYQQRRVIMLRPVTGAVLGVVVWLASRFGVLTVFNIDSHSEHGAFLAVAFIAGFGERLFLQRLLPSTS